MRDKWFYGYRCNGCGEQRDEGDGWPPITCECWKGPRWHHFTLMIGMPADGPREIHPGGAR